MSSQMGQKDEMPFCFYCFFITMTLARYKLSLSSRFLYYIWIWLEDKLLVLAFCILYVQLIMADVIGTLA